MKSIIKALLGLILIPAFSSAQDFEVSHEVIHTINSPFDEGNVRLHPNGKLLAYSRANHPYNQGGKSDLGDIWLAEYDSTWKVARDWHEVNNQYITSPIGWTSDGKSFLFNQVKFEGGTLETQIKVLVGNRVETLDIPFLKNKSQLQSGCISLDNRFIIVSMESANTYGVEDLYVIERTATGWSGPKNLGKDINTRFQELTPFLSPDGRTLYFATNGRKGYGSFDIFKSERLDDTWQNWSPPVNLGPAVNSTGRENSFCYVPGSEYAYFISTQNSDGYGDIRRVKFAKPDTTQVQKDSVFALVTEKREKINGVHLLNAMTSEPISNTRITLSAYPSNSYTTDANGFLYFNNDFTTELEVDGYLSQRVSIVADTFMTVSLEPLKVGRTIRLENVLFQRGTAAIVESSYEELNRVVAMMNKNPEVRILLKGHTDGLGNPEMNLKLSQERVDRVRKYLISQGVKKTRIEGKGLGGEEPIASNDTEETRQLNRRVEFEIIK